MKNTDPMKYGTLEWFTREFSNVANDPWGLEWRPSQKVRYARTIEILEAIDSPVHLVLDVGCALGDFTHALSFKYKRAKIIGIDFVETAISRARHKFPQMAFTQASVFEIGDRYCGQADLITCLELLYYLNRNDCPAALDSISRALRPGGHVIFSSFISRYPYFAPEEFIKLVSSLFEIRKTSIVHVKILSTIEKMIKLLENKMKQMNIIKNISCLSNAFHLFPFRTAMGIEAFSRKFSSIFQTHIIVLAKKS